MALPALLPLPAVRGEREPHQLRDPIFRETADARLLGPRRVRRTPRTLHGPDRRRNLDDHRRADLGDPGPQQVWTRYPRPCLPPHWPPRPRSLLLRYRRPPLPLCPAPRGRTGCLGREPDHREHPPSTARTAGGPVPQRPLVVDGRHRRPAQQLDSLVHPERLAHRLDHGP